MAPSSQNLDFLPILARAMNFSRSSIAPAYHYSLTCTSEEGTPHFAGMPLNPRA
jgi:hypothetical protein